MRSFAFLLFVAISICSRGQVLQTTKKTIVYKQTADWCGPCGEWGWQLFDSLNNVAKFNLGFNGFLVSLHDQSTQQFLNASIASALIDNVVPPSSGYPSFFINNRDNAGIPTYVSFGINGYIVTKAVDSLTSRVGQETSVLPDAAIGFAKLQGPADSLIFKAKVKFQKNVSGEYRLAIYVLEDSVTGWQTNQAGMVIHKHLLRGDVQHGVWGTLLQSGPISINQEFEPFFRMKLPSFWSANNLRFLAIVYKKDPASGKYVIDNVTDQYATGTNVPERIDLLSYSIFPNPARDKITITAPRELKEFHFYLTDFYGRKFTTEGYLSPDKKSLNLRVPANFAPGVYNLHIINGRTNMCETVIIEK
jgi:hypothetical protein